VLVPAIGTAQALLLERVEESLHVLYLERVESLASEVGDQVQPDGALVPFGRLGLEVSDVHLKPVPQVLADLPGPVGHGDPVLRPGLQLDKLRVRVLPRVAVDELALAGAVGDQGGALAHGVRAGVEDADGVAQQAGCFGGCGGEPGEARCPWA
jgi:hypothetical protein